MCCIIVAVIKMNDGGIILMEKKFKHLDMIQGIVNRMAGNSFMLKGWTVTLIAGVFALASKDVDECYFGIAYIPILIFWGLDSYYLQQEKLYRSLYEKITNTEEKDIDFSLKASLKEFDDKENHYLNSLFSKTEMFFYFPLVIVCSGIILRRYF